MLLIAISGISIIAILYFIFRGESYRKTLAASKKETNTVRHKVSELSEMIEVLSAELTSAYHFRVKHRSSIDDDISNYASLLINALPSVISSSLHKDKLPHESLKDFCAINGGSVTEFELFLSTQSDEFANTWKAKDVLSYVRLCRMLLDAME